jgi:hypothetical protein
MATPVIQVGMVVGSVIWSVSVRVVSSGIEAGRSRLLPLLLAAGGLAVAAAGCGEKSEPAVHAPTTAPATTTAPAPTTTPPATTTRPTPTPTAPVPKTTP